MEQLEIQKSRTKGACKEMILLYHCNACDEDFDADDAEACPFCDSSDIEVIS
jgi:rRNA maturation endonuclease Nob1